MDDKEKKKLVVTLIVTDLVNRKLVQGLHKLNIDASAYELLLSDTIFDLMGFGKRCEDLGLYDKYSVFRDNSLDSGIDIKNRDNLNTLACMIFEQLLIYGKEDDKA